MHGTSNKPPASSTEGYNPLYKAPEEKVKTEGQQAEPTKLHLIVEKKKQDSIRSKIKSIAPRTPRRTQGSEVVNILPAPREHLAGPLTKINLQALDAGRSLHSESSDSEISRFPKLTPRISQRTKNFLIRPKITATEPIDEGEDRGTEAANIQVTHLAAFIPTRAKEELSASEDSAKAPSDDVDTQEEHIGSIAPDAENPLPSVKIKQPFFEKPVFQSPRAVSTTLRRPVIEKHPVEESLNPTSSEEEGIVDLGKISKIELVEVHRAFSPEEYTALLMAEKKKKKIQDSRTPAKLATQEKRSILPSARNKALQVVRSIGSTIRELNNLGSASKTMRALNILYRVINEESVIDLNLHPETLVLSEYLGPLSPKERFALLKSLYKEVEEHLNLQQASELQRAFSHTELVEREFGRLDLPYIARILNRQLDTQTEDEADSDH